MKTLLFLLILRHNKVKVLLLIGNLNAIFWHTPRGDTIKATLEVIDCLEQYGILHFRTEEGDGA